MFLSLAAGSLWGWGNPSLGPSLVSGFKDHATPHVCICHQDTIHLFQPTIVSSPGMVLQFLRNLECMIAYQSVRRADTPGSHLNSQR